MFNKSSSLTSLASGDCAHLTRSNVLHRLCDIQDLAPGSTWKWALKIKTADVCMPKRLGLKKNMAPQICCTELIP